MELLFEMKFAKHNKVRLKKLRIVELKNFMLDIWVHVEELGACKATHGTSFPNNNMQLLNKSGFFFSQLKSQLVSKKKN